MILEGALWGCECPQMVKSPFRKLEVRGREFLTREFSALLPPDTIFRAQLDITEAKQLGNHFLIT